MIRRLPPALRRPRVVLALAFLVVSVSAAAAADLVAPYPPIRQSLREALSGPTAAHLLGSDLLGRDILSRLIYAMRSAYIGAAVGLTSFLLIGVPAGIVAGYFGGWIDRIISGAVDTLLSVPAIIIVLVVISVFYGNQTVPMLVFGLLASASLTRVARSATLVVRRELYVDAARVAGLAESRILASHILPRIAGPIIVQASLFAAFAILIQAGLGFLGFGPLPPNPSLGQMVLEASQLMSRQPWLLVPAGSAITLTVIAFATVGEGVRDATVGRWSGVAMRATTSAPTTAASVSASPAPGALLSVCGLSVSFESSRADVPVVEDVSFDVMPGGAVGIVGESGCGKTVTMLAILGLLPETGRVTSGQCFFQGRDLLSGDMSTARVRGRQIGLVSQDAMVGLDPAFTIENTISEFVRRHQPAQREVRRRALELLDMVGLPSPDVVARRYPHELSGGMAQRVAIAAALAGDPALLIADEPTTALDVTIQAEILELLRTLRSRGLAILLVTHDLGLLADLCDRAVIMYAGQVVEQGAVGRIFARPFNPYTEGLLLSSPDRAKPREPLISIPGAVPQPEEWPAGCRFAPRCRYALERCTLGRVALVNVRSDKTRCIRAAELYLT